MSCYQTLDSEDVSDIGVVALKDQRQDIGKQLQRAMQELDDLLVDKLKETLAKLKDLLVLCEKSKGSKGAIEQFTSLVEEVVDKVLDPILSKKQLGEIEMSEVLTENIQSLFKELFDVVPEKRQYATISGWIFSSVDLDSTLEDANPKIDVVVKNFLNQGIIQCYFSDATNHHVLDLKRGDELISNPTQYRGITCRRRPWDKTCNDLAPAIHGVLETLPTFRILILGKPGVGKSSLISNILGVPHSEIAQFRAQGTNINDELRSDTNPNFIVHDSLGVEFGTIKQFRSVEKFIRERYQRPEVSDHIHAIWLCLTVPVDGVGVFKDGDERLFKINPGVPMIVAFMKYDLLVHRKTAMHSRDYEIPEDKLSKIAKVSAGREFNRVCVQALVDIYTKKLQQINMPPWLRVSMRPGYESTPVQLAELTRTCVAQMVDRVIRARPSELGSRFGVLPFSQTIWLTWGIAQRASADLNVDVSMAIGRKRFWSDLALSTYFEGKTLRQCFDTLHEDIILAWNIYDPSKLLASDRFKAMMTGVIDDLVDENSNPAQDVTISIVTDSNRLIETPAPQDPVDPPAKWVNDMYRHTPGVLRCLIAYIVDLTTVMRRLLSYVREKGMHDPLQETLLRQVLDEFSHSRSKTLLHSEIRTFVEIGVLYRGRQDCVLEEIFLLIARYRSTTE